MRAYLDTNVLVSALQPSHVHHPRSFAVLAEVRDGVIAGYLSGHGLAELYSVLTRAPFGFPVTALEIAEVIRETVVPFLNIVDVTAKAHLAAIAVCADAGWKGGRIHDAVHIQAATQAGCDCIYTYDVAHFQSLAPEWGERSQPPPAA
jgi:predicted nucleic acid-binding protein